MKTRSFVPLCFQPELGSAKVFLSIKVVRTIDKHDRSIQVVRFNFLFASTRGDRRARSRTRVLGANDDDDDDDEDDEGRFGCRRFTLTRARLIPLLLLRIALRRVARADGSCSIARPTAGCSNERRKEGTNERCRQRKGYRRRTRRSVNKHGNER